MLLDPVFDRWYWWLAGGYDLAKKTIVEVDSMVVSWWIVAFLCSVRASEYIWEIILLDPVFDRWYWWLAGGYDLTKDICRGG